MTTAGCIAPPPGYPRVIEAHGYTVVLHSRNRATVSGGRLPKPTAVTKLLGEGDSNPKTAKNLVPTLGLSLYPHKGIGFGNLCAFAKNCIKSCLAHQGQGPVPAVAAARVAKSVVWYLARDWFLDKLHRELTAFRQKHPPDDVIGVRLNMFSDVSWEDYGVIDAHPGIQFYDYTKDPRRWGWVRPNYWVTFSYDGTNYDEASRILNAGGNVSVVFYLDTEEAVCGKAAHRQPLPERWREWVVIDGGESDWRPDDPRGVIVGLRLLARTYESREDAIESGFGQRVNDLLTLVDTGFAVVA